MGLNGEHKRQARLGMTILEMTVVLAMVGLVAMIGVPALQSSRAKSLQKEAQTNLSILFGLVTNFRVASGTNTACLRRLGFDPTTYVKHYAIGFDPSNISSTCGFNPISRTQSCLSHRYNSVGTSEEVCDVSEVGFSATATAAGGTFTSADLAGTSITHNTFLMQARGRVRSIQPDIWTIDQNKQLINTQSGI